MQESNDVVGGEEEIEDDDEVEAGLEQPVASVPVEAY